jgi:hypothetical protein
MQLDLIYLPHEDRMRFSVRGQADWLLTRSLLIKWVNAWLEQLERVALPQVGILLGPRDFGQEHALSLEFDAPHDSGYQPLPAPVARLMQECTLTVDALGTLLVLKGEGQQTRFQMTRKESHLVLELLACKARAVHWIEAVAWPRWLGVVAREGQEPEA